MIILTADSLELHTLVWHFAVICRTKNIKTLWVTKGCVVSQAGSPFFETLSQSTNFRRIRSAPIESSQESCTQAHVVYFSLAFPSFWVYWLNTRFSLTLFFVAVPSIIVIVSQRITLHRFTSFRQLNLERIPNLLPSSSLALLTTSTTFRHHGSAQLRKCAPPCVLHCWRYLDRRP